MGRWSAAGALALVLGLSGQPLAAASGGPTDPALSASRPERRSDRPEPSGRADYKIQARVDDLEDGGKGLTGTLRLTWENRTDAAAEELWFHLYWNGFANNRSTHLVESGGRLRDRNVSEDGWGWQRVTSVRVNGQDVFSSFAYRQPDGGSLQDRSVFSVQAPKAIKAGGMAEVQIEWEARIPQLQRRTGAKDDFLLIAHWFPKLGVFEGERGWNCHEFHAWTEFFSDYGRYDVTLDLPERYESKVFASGLQVGPPTVEGGRAVTHFEAPSPQDRERLDAAGRAPLVHDFTWTADPRFKLRRSTFNFDLWRSQYEDEVAAVQSALGADVNLRLRSVQVSVLMHPEREAQWERHFEATCATLFFYGLWFGEYPYEHITVVDPAWGAGAAGGMEYPTLFTAGSRMYTRPSMHTPEGVVVHECGHQFWHGLVGNNEFEAAWLDEGFNSYSDSEVLWRVWGAREATTDYAGIPMQGVQPTPGTGGGRLARMLSLRAFPVPVLGFELEPLRPSGFVDLWRDQAPLTAVHRLTDPRAGDRIGYLSDPDRDRIDTPGWLYADRTGYRTNSYQRPAAALRTLEGLVGREAFLRGMRHYADTWRYRHPYPDDFFAAFQEGCGKDVGWYFEEVFRGWGTVDWSVNVQTRRAAAAAGLFQSEPGGEFARPSDAAQEEAGEGSEAAPEKPKRATQPWKSEVLVSRRGTLRLDLDIELRFEDGTSERRTWTRQQQATSAWLAIDLEGPNALSAVVLDPDRRYWLDADLSNNNWFAERDTLAPLRWGERAFNRWLHLLHWQAGIGG
jgi:hypothetical protein